MKIYWCFKQINVHVALDVCHKSLHVIFVGLPSTTKLAKNKRHTKCNVLQYLTSTPFQVDSLLNLTNVLIQDQQDQPDEEEDPEDFAEEQGMMGRFIHLLYTDEPDQQYLVRSRRRRTFSLLVWKVKLSDRKPNDDSPFRFGIHSDSSRFVQGILLFLPKWKDSGHELKRM